MDWFYATEEDKCTIVVYSIGEFISSQLPGRPQEGAVPLARAYQAGVLRTLVL